MKLAGVSTAVANRLARCGAVDSFTSGVVGAEVPTVGPPRRPPRDGTVPSSTDDCGDCASELCSITRIVAAREM